MAHHVPGSVIQRVLEYLDPQDVAFRACLLNKSWYTASLEHLYRVIPPFSSAFQLSQACRTIIAHPDSIARSVLEISIVHSMQDVEKVPTLYYIVRAALALCTRLEVLFLHTNPSVMRIMLGECTFQLKAFSVIDCHQDLPTVFLSRQEGLEELTILRGDATPLYLPKDALPNLSSFSGIPENAVRISRGRRLKTLRILPGPTPLNLGNTLFRLDSLVMSSLTEFHVLVTGSVLHHVNILAQYLPRLTTVVIRYYQHNIPFGGFANTISMFVNLREYSMLSLNMHLPLSPVALDSEYSIVMLYHKHCPSLQIVVLRRVCWMRGHEGDSDWTPQADDPEIFAMWQVSCERRQMDIKIAEDILHDPDGDTDDCSSGDCVTMDLDGPSDDSETPYGNEPVIRQLLVYRDKIEDTKPLVVIEKGSEEVQTLSPQTAEGLIEGSSP